MDIILDSLDATQGKPIVIITIVNTFAYPAFLAPARLSSDLIDGDYFEFGREVPYLGTKGNGTYTPDELILLQPEQTLKTIINLSDLYELGQTKGLIVNYTAAHPVDGLQADWVTLQSNNIRL